METPAKKIIAKHDTIPQRMQSGFWEMVSAESVISQSGAENARNRRIFLVEMISRICYNGIRQAGETAKERKYSYGRIFDIYQGKAHQPGGGSGHRRDPSQSPPAPERVRHCGHPVPGRQHSPERHFTAADGAAGNDGCVRQSWQGCEPSPASSWTSAPGTRRLWRW